MKNGPWVKKETGTFNKKLKEDLKMAGALSRNRDMKTQEQSRSQRLEAVADGTGK